MKIQQEPICSHPVSYGLLLKISKLPLQKFEGCVGCSKADARADRYKHLITFCCILHYFVYLLIDFIVIISDIISKNVIHTSAVFRYILAFFQSHLSIDIKYFLQLCSFLKLYQSFYNFSNKRNNRGMKHPARSHYKLSL